MAKITVVSPVYNVAPYLDQCIMSLINQSYNNWEAIFVDDGSVDDSVGVIEKYVKVDSRIRLIKQDNGGAGAARNSGLKLAQGEYIYFLDPDDWMDTDLLRDNIQLMRDHELDVIIFRHRDIKPSGVVKHSKATGDLELFSRQNTWVGVILKLNFCGTPMTAWNKIYKKSVIDRSGAVFSDTRTGEDAIFNISLGAFIDRYAFNDKLYYNYRISRAGSLLYNNLEKFSDDLRVLSELRKNSGVSTELINARTILIVYRAITTAANVSLKGGGSSAFKAICRDGKYLESLNGAAASGLGDLKLVLQYSLARFPSIIFWLVKARVLAPLPKD